MIEVVRYTPEHELAWNLFVQKAKNGHFMFNRQFMDYHAERFKDCSLLFFKESKLVALLPAHKEKNVLISHRGLTFGGILTDSKMTLRTMQETWLCVLYYMKLNSLAELSYKPVPACYQSIPSYEDISILLQLGAKAKMPDVLSVIDLKNRPKYFKGTSQSIQKAKTAQLSVRRSSDIKEFYNLLSVLLKSKYASKPIHMEEELVLLMKRFPENIVLYEVYNYCDLLLAGILLFVNIGVIHTQYIAANDEGKRSGAIPFLLDKIMQEYQKTHRYLSLGTSKGGDYVNEGLYQFKESLGARAMLQEQFVLRGSV